LNDHPSCTDPSALFGDPLRAAIAWSDANASLFENWLEWQRGCWQPFLDVQAIWMRHWQDQLGAMAFARGAEQLA
jgi:hypothetical protein